MVAIQFNRRHTCNFYSRYPVLRKISRSWCSLSTSLKIISLRDNMLLSCTISEMRQQLVDRKSRILSTDVALKSQLTVPPFEF